MSSFILTNEDREDLLVLTQKLKSGELSPESPCEGASAPWTEEEKVRLKLELERVFGWDRSRGQKLSDAGHKRRPSHRALPPDE